MLRKYSKFIAVVVIVSGLALALPSQDAFAQQRGGYGWEARGRHGETRHYYRNGRWYRHGWFGFDIAVSALAIGALIDSLPPRCNTVVVGGVPYYYYDNYYCRPYPYGGYVVVAPPAVTQPVVVVPEAPPIIQPQAQEALTINIPNSRGGYTAVMLRRAGNGFVGPQGEYYPNNPTVAQLRALYGR